jgi:Cellulose biosynthesis protein BcsS
MRRVASVALAIAMAVAPSLNTNTASVKRDSGGGETLIHERAPFDLLEFLRPARPTFRDLPFPLPGINKPVSSQYPPEGTHLERSDFMLFSGGDTWRHWAFSHAGMLWSPKGLDNSNLTIKVLSSGGLYRYVSSALNNRTVIGRQYAVSITPGWRFKRNNTEITAYAGLDYQHFYFVPIDPSTNLLGRHIGMRATVELWHEPSPTTMLAADASYSSIGAGNHARLAYGWRLFEHLYVGPEVQAYITGEYKHARAGIHMTAAKHYEHEWTAAIGMAGRAARA